MTSVEQLLRSLERPEVDEVALASDRLPSARVGSSFEPLSDEPLSAEAILGMLVATGGSRYVDALGPTPKQWAARLPGLGEITVSATVRGGKVLARFSLAARASVRGAEGARPPRRSDAPRTSRSSRPAKRSARPIKANTEPSRRPPSPEPSRRPILPETTRAMRAQGDGLRRALTAPALPRVKGGDESIGPQANAGLELDSPSPPPLPAHVRIKAASSLTASSAKMRAWKTTDVDTEPPPSAGPTNPEIGGLLDGARRSSASDLHIVAGRPPLFRIGGQLYPRGDVLVAEAVERMICPLIPPRLAAVLAREGSCDFALEDPERGRFRVNVSRQHTGLKVCLRLVPRELPTLSALGLPSELARVTSHRQGLVVFTGPTGHGKTTTLTAVVNQLNETTTHHIIIVEDPVENIHPKKKALISQREVGTHTATFASALRAALREDPDVIVVGELRDVETVRMAVAASETGHLVLGTMNAPSAAKTIERLIDLFPPADQPQIRLTLASSLRLIVGQRLVPNHDRSRVHAAIELLPGSTPLSGIIRDSKTFQIPSLQQRGKALGIIRLDDSLADLVKAGRVRADDVLPLAQNPQELEAALMGRPLPSSPGIATR